MTKEWFYQHKLGLLGLLVVILAIGLLASCDRSEEGGSSTAQTTGLSADANALAQERGFTPDDVYAALKTYMPTGELDPYIMFASGGQGGQVLVIGVPSMRILKVIGVFTPEPWQGYGYGGSSNEVLAGGFMDEEHPLLWGDTHHPSISETNGEYDGKFLFINDKANARLAIIDLRDFETKQLIKNPNAINDHGGAFVTPNTEYVIEGPQYAAPIGWEYASLDDYNAQYRGLITFWKFDRVTGRVDESKSFQIELPPYWQDLCDAGKGPSEGWIFCNSFNTELATGGVELGNPPFEAGTTKNDTDYLHIINWKAAEEVYNAGKYEMINGIAVISLQTAIDEKLLYFTPEPKSPHGADVTPGGEYIVVGGKLDPHVTIYSFDKIMKAIEGGGLDTDVYGVPVIPLDASMEAQVELGLGPLHTVFDDKGYAYTSLFLDSAVARWALGGPYADKHPEDGWTLVQKLPVHYNIGHITAAEGDTATPDGQFVVALNKWSIDRFANVGPLLPQNFQLVDISRTGDQMKLLYDMPIGMAEPHYAQIIKADKLQPFEVYPEIGWNPETMSVDPNGIKTPEEARVERNGDTVEVWMAVIRSHFTPERVELKEGDHVIWHLTNLERTRDATHGFALSGYNINLSLEPGETQTVEFDATQPGTYTFYCTEFCSALHLEMLGYFLVEPKE
ncbi:MAG: Sec-dependent nitrous-oxide reductase [Chloroflexi bacterium]|nr:Sec-dependent nitrous-oxide reductase [Ardenticatenaceae bacterium]MBL1129833.1 Sec-dependent nitrous-oxide reductase [Chloroflexota bacterium]NOG35917.1 Sec-dependent nitrous-oxide reductase [Chloroflexota bacterium]